MLTPAGGPDPSPVDMRLMAREVEMKCSNCDSEGPFDSNDGEVNRDLTYCCKKCGEHIDIGSCDGCKRLFVIDDLTDEPPYNCAECHAKARGKDVEPK